MRLHVPEAVGTALGALGLSVDTVFAKLPILTTEIHASQVLWVDVLMFAMRAVAVLGVAIAPTVVGKMIDHKLLKKGKEK